MTDPAIRTTAIRVAIVDDHPLVGQGLASLLAREHDIEVIGLGASLAEAAALLASPEPPEVLLLDIRLGDESGLDFLSGAKRPDVAVIVLTAYDYAAYRAAAHRLGAAGVVLKTDSLASLVDAIRRVAGGGLAFDRRPADVTVLTPRERSVVALLLDGCSNDEIGATLGITTRTVEAHLARLYERLSIGSRTELATAALREGWMDVPSEGGR